jgi:uncharacterized protein (DUF1697 family)
MAKPGIQYLALLRGINVGGNNLIAMDELRGFFEGLGFGDVATYINSGNVLFRAPRQALGPLSERIEGELAKRVGRETRALVLTEAKLRAIVRDAPDEPGFGEDDHRTDAIFLFPPMTPARAWKVVEMKEGVDRAWKGKGVIYHARLTARATSSRMGRMVGTPAYQDMTIRSWGTITKLLQLMDERG